MKSALPLPTALIQAIFSCAKNTCIFKSFLTFLTVTFCIAAFGRAAVGQCPPGGPTAPPIAPTIAAEAGPGGGQIRVTGTHNDPHGHTTFFFVLADGSHSYLGTTSPSQPQFSQLVDGLGANWLYYFRAQTTNCIGSSAFVTASARTFDLPNPPIAASSGPGPNNVTVWSQALGNQSHGFPVGVYIRRPPNHSPELLIDCYHDGTTSGQPVTSVSIPGLYIFYAESWPINYGLEKKKVAQRIFVCESKWGP